MIGLVAVLNAVDGKGGELFAAFQSFASQVKEKEEGILQYDPFVLSDNPDTVVMVERYASQEVFDAHVKTDHMKETWPTIETLLDGPPKVQMLKG